MRNTVHWLMSGMHKWWPQERVPLISAGEVPGAALWEFHWLLCESCASHGMRSFSWAGPREQSSVTDQGSPVPDCPDSLDRLYSELHRGLTHLHPTFPSLSSSVKVRAPSWCESSPAFPDSIPTFSEKPFSQKISCTFNPFLAFAHVRTYTHPSPKDILYSQWRFFRLRH